MTLVSTETLLGATLCWWTAYPEGKSEGPSGQDTFFIPITWQTVGLNKHAKEKRQQ